MSLRSSWSGQLCFGLVNIPVKLYTVISTTDRGKMHQYHVSDNGRVKMPKTCSVCGKGLEGSEIIRGYELGKDIMIPITEEDMATLPLPSGGAMSILGFVEEESTTDYRWFDEVYYVSIDDKFKGAAKAFTLLNSVMEKMRVVGVTKVAFRDKEHLAVVRPDPSNGILIIQTLHWAEEIKEPTELKVAGTVSEEEMKLGEMLVGNMRKPVDLASFKDEYNEALKKLVDAKASGQVITAPAAAKPTVDTSLLDSLMASLGPVSK
jgi:DNA end-binding protein Ku